MSSLLLYIFRSIKLPPGIHADLRVTLKHLCDLYTEQPSFPTPRWLMTQLHRCLSSPYSNADALSPLSHLMFLRYSAYDQMIDITISILLSLQGLGKRPNGEQEWPGNSLFVTLLKKKQEGDPDRCQGPRGSIYLCSPNKRLYLASRQVSKRGCVGSHLQRNYFCFSVITCNTKREWG